MAECFKVTQKTQICFTWQLLAEDLNETCDVQLLCRHAVGRGVHLPKAWRNKWNLSGDVPPVEALAREAVQRARVDYPLPDATKLDCRRCMSDKMRARSNAHLDARTKLGMLASRVWF